MKRLLTLGLMLCLAACSAKPGQVSDATPGPSVLGKHKGETDQVWIPFTDVSGEKNPVLVSEGYLKTFTNPNFSSSISVIDQKYPMIYLAKYDTGTGHKDAPTSITQQYITIGGKEYGTNSYHTIGFGYVSSRINGSPVIIGSQETNPNESTIADFIVATRDTTTTTPSIKLRVTGSGSIQASSSYVPTNKNDLATKSYVDGLILSSERPTKPVFGESYFSKTQNRPEWFNGTKWVYSDGKDASP